MARVTRVPNGYEFSGLSGIGMRLVNEFQRQHPLLCVPSSEPNHRFIHLGSPPELCSASRTTEELRGWAESCRRSQAAQLSSCGPIRKSIDTGLDWMPAVAPDPPPTNVQPLVQSK